MTRDEFIQAAKEHGWRRKNAGKHGFVAFTRHEIGSLNWIESHPDTHFMVRFHRGGVDWAMEFDSITPDQLDELLR